MADLWGPRHQFRAGMSERARLWSCAPRMPWQRGRPKPSDVYAKYGYPPIAPVIWPLAQARARRTERGHGARVVAAVRQKSSAVGGRLLVPSTRLGAIPLVRFMGRAGSPTRVWDAVKERARGRRTEGAWPDGA